mgnify:CR=1 FL=1
MKETIKDELINMNFTKVKIKTYKKKNEHMKMIKMNI